MFKTLKAAYKGAKLQGRLENIFGKKNVKNFLDKRKGLGKSRRIKIHRYIDKKPDSAMRRIGRINKAIDASPYVATGAAAVGTGYFLNRQDDKE